MKKGVNRGKSFTIEVDGEKVLAYKGETIAAGQDFFRCGYGLPKTAPLEVTIEPRGGG